LSADGIIVKGSMFLCKDQHATGFYSEGEVRLLDAQIGENLECEGGAFVSGWKKNLDGDDSALNAERAEIKGDVFLSASEWQRLVPYRGIVLRGTFQAVGIVSFSGARIVGNMDLRRSLLTGTQLKLERATVGSMMFSKGHWPKPGNLFLDGFVYGRIADGPADADTNLTWIALQPQKPFRPQPFLQLAKVLREAGDDDGERQVLVAMEDRRWMADHPPAISPIRLPFKVVAGYGYRPLWAAWEIMGLSALGWIIYRRSYLAGSIVPAEKDACGSFRANGMPPDYHPRFSPFVYSVENSLPLVKLGQADKWQPDPRPLDASPVERVLPTSFSRTKATTVSPRWRNSVLVALGLKADTNTRTTSRMAKFATSAKFVRLFLWIQILLGWLLATLFIAGVTGLVRKD
jgi:hypothetical protein